MSQFVLDASAALSWCFADADDAFGDRLLTEAADGGVVVPALWHTEVANALLLAQRRGRIDAAELRFLGELFDRLPIQTDAAMPERGRRAVLQLARETGLTVHDATYLDLAIRRQLPLATLDTPLRQAALALRVPTLDP